MLVHFRDFRNVVSGARARRQERPSSFQAETGESVKAAKPSLHLITALSFFYFSLNSKELTAETRTEGETLRATAYLLV